MQNSQNKSALYNKKLLFCNKIITKNSRSNAKNTTDDKIPITEFNLLYKYGIKDNNVSLKSNVSPINENNKNLDIIYIKTDVPLGDVSFGSNSSEIDQSKMVLENIQNQRGMDLEYDNNHNHTEYLMSLEYDGDHRCVMESKYSDNADLCTDNLSAICTLFKLSDL